MLQDRVFRKIWEDEVPDLFDLVLRRIQWMDERGIKQWNVTGYAEAYPLSYYEQQRQLGSVYVLTDGESSEILCGAVLREADERWDDETPALYLHNFVSKIGAHGAGTAFLRIAEAYARNNGKQYFRLDSAEDNPKLAKYYEELGFVAVGSCVDGPYQGILREKRI